MAGCLAQQHAEVLASFVIAGATRPGTPVMYCSRINPLDLRRAVSSWGGPEVGIASAAATQLAHRIGFTCDAYGLCTSASVLDPAYAYQRMANAMIPALAGTDILSGVGNLDSGLAGCLEAAVIDDEMIGLIKHIVRGYEVTPETLAFDVMREVIPQRRHVPGGHAHRARDAQGRDLGAQAGRFDRRPRPGERGGARRVQVTEILRRHEVAPLPDDVLRHLDEIVAEGPPRAEESSSGDRRCTAAALPCSRDIARRSSWCHLIAVSLHIHPEEEHHDQANQPSTLPEVCWRKLSRGTPRPGRLRRAPAPAPARLRPARRLRQPWRPRRPSPPLAAGPKILRIRLYSDMANIDPAFRTSNNDETIMDCVFSKLVTYGPGSYELKNDLAEKIESSEPTARPSRSRSVKGSSGRRATAKLTTEDVKYSYERIADPAREGCLCG